MLILPILKILSLFVLVSTEENCSSPGGCTNLDAEGFGAKADEPSVDNKDVVEETHLPVVNIEVMEDSHEPHVQSETHDILEKEPEDPHCPSRDYVIRCASKHLDINKNNKLERAELEAAMEKLPWYSKGAIKILGSLNSIMSKCDADGDDVIGIADDMEQTKERCLATCVKRRAFQKAFIPECDLQ